MGDDFFTSGADPHAHASVLQGYLHCLNNLTACHLSTNQFYKAKQAATKLLSVDPRNIKGLLRAAKATLALTDFEECELCLQTVLADEPANSMAKAEMAKLRRARSSYRADARAMETKIARGIFADATDKAESKVRDAGVVAGAAADSAETRQGPPGDGAGLTAVRAADVDGDKEAKPERAPGPSNALLLVGTSCTVLVLSLLIALYFYGK